MSLAKSFFTVSGYTLISRISGYARDMMVAAVMGTGPLAEAYLIAFKLPNFFRRIFAEGAFNAAFVPIFAGMLTEKGQAEASNFAARVMSVLLTALILVEIVMLLFMPYFMMVMAPGFTDNASQLELATTLTRITFPYLLLISLVSLYSGILNSLGKFAIVAASPIILNVCMIGMLHYATPYLASPAHALAKSITLAGVLQLVWVIYGCRKAGITLHLSLPRLSPDVKHFLRKMAPGVVGAGVVQINLMVDVMIATMVPGAIAYLYYAERVSQLPLSLVGTAMGTAMLPLLSRQIREGKRQEAAYTQNRALELTMFLTLPSAAALAVISQPIIIALFQRGEFEMQAAIATAYGMVGYAVGLPAFVLVKILMSSYFADGDTKTPVKTALVAMLVNLVLNILVLFTFEDMGWMPHIGIALATAVASWVNVVMLAVGLRRRGEFVTDARLRQRLLRISVATLAMVAVLVVAQMGLHGWIYDGEVHRSSALLLLVAAGAGTFFVVAYALKAFDVQEIKGFLRRKK